MWNEFQRSVTEVMKKSHTVACVCASLIFGINHSFAIQFHRLTTVLFNSAFIACIAWCIPIQFKLKLKGYIYFTLPYCRVAEYTMCKLLLSPLPSCSHFKICSICMHWNKILYFGVHPSIYNLCTKESFAILCWHPRPTYQWPMHAKSKKMRTQQHVRTNLHKLQESYFQIKHATLWTSDTHWPLNTSRILHDKHISTYKYRALPHGAQAPPICT